MKTIEIYETNDGSRFEKKEEAIKYEEQCNKCNSIYLKIGVIKRKLKENEYIQHDPGVVKSAFKEFMRIVSETFPDYSDIAIKCGEFITPMSFLYLAIIDSGNDAFIRLMHRFYCMDFDNGKEFQNRMFISYQDFVTEKVNTDINQN